MSYYDKQDIGSDNYQYLMKDIRMPPRITFLALIVMTDGHAFGASLFHVLKNCTDLTSLSLHFDGTMEVNCLGKHVEFGFRAMTCLKV